REPGRPAAPDRLRPGQRRDGAPARQVDRARAPAHDPAAPGGGARALARGPAARALPRGVGRGQAARGALTTRARSCGADRAPLPLWAREPRRHAPRYLAPVRDLAVASRGGGADAGREPRGAGGAPAPWGPACGALRVLGAARAGR